MAVGVTPYTSIFELARTVPNSAAFHRLYELSLGHPRCKASPQLQSKYGVKQDNEQQVLRVSNKVTLQQCWWNRERTSKPQTFAAAVSDAAALDATGGGGPGSGCDFCQWQQYTAEDTWGRVEGPHAVSASNLFKYVAPAQGVVLLKHHDPLQFSLEQLQDLVNVSDAWFQRTAADQAARDAAVGLPPRQLHPLLVWNCLPRGGASQFHGHAQVMCSHTPFPMQQAEAEAAAAHDLSHTTTSRGFYQDLLAAHDDVGLLLREGREGDYAFGFPVLAPWKDCEINIHGSSLASPAFQRLLYAALRALVDGLGVATFNACIYGMQLPDPAALAAGSSASASSASSSSSLGSLAASASSGYLASRGMPAPVVARLVSRGKLSNQASDFGGLEVFGGASIGHTDPFRVADAFRTAQAALPPMQ